MFRETSVTAEPRIAYLMQVRFRILKVAHHMTAVPVYDLVLMT